MPCSLCLPRSTCDPSCDGITPGARPALLRARWLDLHRAVDWAGTQAERVAAEDALRAFNERWLEELIPW